MIQPEPEGSTQGYPLVSVEVLRLILIDSQDIKDGGEGTCFQLSQRFIAACSYPTNNYKDIMKAQGGKDYKMAKRDYAWLMISRKRLAKNNEVKMVIYNALPRKEYEIIFMCNTTKEIWKTLLITHQDSAFARFNTIVASLKALDEGYSSKNYVRKFRRALHPKLIAKVTTIEESKDLTSLSLDELIGNLKLRNNLVIEECSTSESEGEEYAMTVRDFKKFFKIRGIGMIERKYILSEPKPKVIKNRSEDLNRRKEDTKLGNCPFRSFEINHRKDKNQRAFFGGSLSDSDEEDEEKAKDETCLVAQASNEICLGVDLEPDEWIKDSGCSKDMTGNQKLFSGYKAYNTGNVIFGSNLSGNIIGKGKICDNKCRVTFSKHDSEITKDGKVIGRGIRKKGLYVIKLGNKPEDKICFAMIDENSMLWHRRLGHAIMRLIQSLASKELVRNLPKLKFDQHFCDACKIGKQAHASHKAKNIVSTTRLLELIHMDLFGPSAVQSYEGNLYTLVIVDDYSRYTWTRFLKNKTEAFEQFEIFSKKIQNQLGCLIVSIRTDHGKEFDNEVQFREFCNVTGITHKFSALRTPQSNGVVEKKNRTQQEMIRTMLNEQSLPQNFWCNTVDTSTYILNRILIRAILGYCQNSKAYIVLNKHTMKIEESLNVKLDETPPPSKTSPLVDDDLDEEESIKVTEKRNLKNDIEDETLEIDKIVNIKESKNHPLENII
uniref:Retrovirus-related Pol polyprotein from transposon TNT 1-94 n=1 Tax=Tanacetum cinerariifolium TaxID=118510 RepID=A0A6L2MIS3_TANCI|nr:retrovirus-related Pol polyprotein from transposon TNT 1-94 [Tanacetum cinerariifolium]